ncbi:hypothetical protein [Paenibacillus wynnii]|uniref:hypothetical protein n=1 Tax=Paenibacillus wynnii TaxID=268407 RepID=UPI002794A827|nr:hypothetical protein [Paenibacillus wynnii]MDQ0195365.1 hypothetical protein [Paenibacillus wynnii]
MHQKYNSRRKVEKPWLTETYKNKSQRTFELGKKAIDQLIKENINISYRKIAEKSKLFDNNNNGIHPNSIRTNQELYNYYNKFVVKKSITKRRNFTSLDFTEINKNYKDIKLNRDKNALRQKYMKYEKRHLIELLINAEEYIAENNKKWIVSQFENFVE